MSYLSILEAVKWLEEHDHKLSDKTLRKYIKQGKLKAIIDVGAKHGDRYLIEVSDLETMLNPGEIQCTTLEPATPPRTVELTVETLEAILENKVVTLENRLLERLEGRLEARDRVLMEFVAEQRERIKQEESKKKRPWWAKLFKST